MTFTRTSNCKDIHKHATFLQKKEKKKKSSKFEEQINSKMVNIELVKDQLITINTIWANEINCRHLGRTPIDLRQHINTGLHLQ